MPKYKITSPEGESLTISADRPPTDDEMKEIFSSRTRKPNAKKVTRDDVMEPEIQKMSGTEKFLTGVGAGLYDFGKGIEQTGSILGEKLGLVNPETVKRITSEGEEARSMMKPLKANSMAASAGEFLGETLPTALVPGGIAGGVAKRALTAGVSQAALGASRFTGEGDNRALNAALGGALGSGGSLALSGLGKTVNAISKPATKSAIGNLADKEGIPLTLGEELNAPNLQRLETTLEKLPGSLGISKFRETQYKAADESAKHTLGQYIANPSKPNFWGNKEFVDSLYHGVQKEAERINVTTKAQDTHKAAKELVERYPSIFESMQDTKTKSIVKNLLYDTSKFKQPPKEIGNITFDDLWTLRKGLGVAKETARAQGNIEAVGVLGSLKHAVDSDIDKLSEKSLSNISDKLKVANESYKRYNVKYEKVQEAYDKASGVKGAGEMGLFSPQKFATSLKNMIYEENVKKKNRLFSDEEVSHLTGIASLMERVKRAGQFKENPPTGARAAELTLQGGMVASAAGMMTHPMETATTAGTIVSSALLAKFLTTTKAGKQIAMSASKMEVDSPGMQKLLDKSIQIAPRALGTGLNEVMGNNQ